MKSLSLGDAREDALAVRLLVLLLPFELVVAQLAHGLFKQVLPAPALLLHPLIALTVTLVVCRQLTRRDVVRQDAVVLAAMALLAMPSAYHVLLGNWWDLRFLLLGVGALLVGLMLSGSGQERSFARLLAVGLLAWSGAVMLVYGMDVSRFLDAHAWARAYDFDQLVLAMRYPESIDLMFFYPLVAGNWNKASNLIVLAYLFIAIAVYRDRAARPLMLTTTAALSVVSILSYSRGGMLVAAGLGACLLLLSRRLDAADRRVWTWLSLLMILPLVLSFVFPAMRQGWFDLTSMGQRVDMIHHAAGAKPPGSAASNMLLGIGVGSYGESQYGNPFSGTHNMFIDLFISGGVLQLSGLLILFAYACFAVVRSGLGSVTQVIGGLAIAAVTALSFREFDLNYLGVSALPSLLIGWFIGEALGPSKGVFKKTV